LLRNHEHIQQQGQRRVGQGGWNLNLEAEKSMEGRKINEFFVRGLAHVIDDDVLISKEGIAMFD
jgi:hypothetical protein